MACKFSLLGSLDLIDTSFVHEGKQNAELERDDGLGHIQNNSGLAKNLANDLNQPKEQEVQEVKAPIDLPTEDIGIEKSKQCLANLMI